MYQRLWPVAGLFLTLFWTELSAQQAACTLLTAADIEATTGEKGMEPHETGMVIPEGPQKGQKLNACMWGGPKKGMVTSA